MGRLRKFNVETPVSTKLIKELSVGDEIYLTGEVVTARDMAHARAIKLGLEGGAVPNELEEAVVYHCGPIVKRADGGWKIISAGPTTSARMENLEPKFVKLFRIRIIVGKGGMGMGTALALKESPGVYCVFVGGAGALAARMVKRVIGVKWLDLGVPEALWKLEVENFGPLTVTIDSKGKNLHEELKLKVKGNLDSVLKGDVAWRSRL